MSKNFLVQWNNLGDYLGSHLLVTIVPLVVGVVIGIPLAVTIVRFRKLQWSVLGVVSVVQTIPGLALLALMVPLLVFSSELFGVDLPSFGFLPAVIALSLYSLLPIVRNTVTGLVGIDNTLIETARALGMTKAQILLKVQFPLAAPIILAGVRTATVWVVGTATLATPVGQTSLGNYIFSGLQTRNWVAVLFGCVAAALLAIILDTCLGWIEKGWSQRKKFLCWLGSIGLLLVAAISLVTWIRGVNTQTSDQILIGSKTFTEQYILADLIKRRLEEKGIPARKIESLGSTIAFEAAMNGDLDVYVDYSGTIWANYMNKKIRANPETVLNETASWIEREFDGKQLGKLGFENTYALALNEDDAKAWGLESISDLAKRSGELSIGGDYEFFERPEWKNLVDQYGLSFDRLQSFDSTFMYEAVKDRSVDVISAFSSDGRIPAYNLKVLKDNLRSFPPYDAVMILSPKASKKTEVVEALRFLVDRIPIELMREANKKVDVDGWSPSEAANWLYGEISLN